MSTQITPQGWYVYSGGQVRGPYSVQELSVAVGSNLSAKVFVSKHGFSKWYPIQQLQTILQSTDRMHIQTQQELHQLNLLSNRLVQRFVDPNLGYKRPEFETHLADLTLKQGRPQGFDVSMQEQEAISPPPFESFRATATMSARTNTMDSKVHPPAPSNQNFSSFKKPSVENRSENTFALPKESEEYRLAIQLTKERLGNQSLSILIPFFYLISLSFYQIFWMKRVNQEVSWHADALKKNLIGAPFIFSVIPMVHYIYFFFLAYHIRRMERQHKISSTSPWLAVVLSSVPPLAMIYLQTQLNKHWKFHSQILKA